MGKKKQVESINQIFIREKTALKIDGDYIIKGISHVNQIIYFYGYTPESMLWGFDIRDALGINISDLSSYTSIISRSDSVHEIITF